MWTDGRLKLPVWLAYSTELLKSIIKFYSITSIVMIMDPDCYNIHAIDYMGSRASNFSAVTCFRKLLMANRIDWFGMSDNNDDNDGESDDSDIDGDFYDDYSDNGGVCDEDDDKFLGSYDEC